MPSFIRRYQPTSSQCSISAPLLKITDVFMGHRIGHIHTYTHNNFAILKFLLTQGLNRLPGLTARIASTKRIQLCLVKQLLKC